MNWNVHPSYPAAAIHYYAGKKVGQAFQPDGAGLSGWKA
jgi:hypothetical protein